MKKIVCSFIFTFVSLVSHAYDFKEAGLFLEPLISYERGRGDIKYPGPFSNSDTRVDGFGVGAKAGFHIFEIVFVGLDGRYSKPQFKDSTLSQNVPAIAWNYGPMVGVQMPFLIGLRAWASYIVDAELDPEKDRRVDEIFTRGNGYRLGAGFRVAIVSLNLEYQHIQYHNLGIEEVGVFDLDYNRGDIKLTNNSLIASVSFPLAL